MLVLQGVEGVVEVVRLRKSWIGEEMLSEASLDDDDSDEVLDLVIAKVLVLMFERRNFDGDGVI